MGILISKLSRLSLNDVRNETENKIDNFVYFEEQNLNTPKEKFIADQILDPRSATVGIRRTPLVLVKVGDTPVRHKAYLETDLDECSKTDDSFTSELEESDVEENSINKESISEDFKNCDISIGNLEIDENYPQEANNFGINGLVGTPMKEKVKKTYIYEDNVLTPESTPVKLKGGRTPLGVVSTNNSAIPSPIGKPWRGIREERLRLGLENTPPPAHEPFPDVVQSAPGKVGVKRSLKKSWTKAHWAFDESVVI